MSALPKGVKSFWEHIYDEDAPMIMITGGRHSGARIRLENMYGVPYIPTLPSYKIKGDVINVKKL